MTSPLGTVWQEAVSRYTASGPEPHTAYQKDPIGWAVDRLGIPRHTLVWSANAGYTAHAWDGTPDPLVVMAQALADWEDVGVESGTGTGKSFFAAVLVLWFLACFKSARVFTFAVKEDQLRLYIWKEIGKLWPRFKDQFPSATLSDLRIRVVEGSDDWGAWGYSVAVKAGETSATAAQGMHAEHMLLIYEEAPGINPAVLEAGANTCTAPHNMRLAMGNPDSQDDALHQFCEQRNVTHVVVSALDHPNIVTDDASVVPGAVSHKSIADREAKYGVGSIMYDSRVRGISPAQAADALIKRSWLEAAAKNYDKPDFRVGKRALGVDVANSQSGDKASIADGIGACLLSVEAFPCADANELGADVVDRARACDPQIRPQHIGVDSVGVGAGTVNEAKRLGMLVQSLNGGAKALPVRDDEMDISPGQRQVLNAEKFANLRASMHWQFREDVRRGKLALPDDPELFADLVTPRWWTQGGKIFVEAKEDIRERLGRSPDKGDSAVYWNWVRDRKFVKPVEEHDDYHQPISPELHRANVERESRIRTINQRKQQRIIDPEYGEF